MESDTLHTILAIDDKRDSLTALKAVLADALPGVRVLTALNGPEGLELARAEDPEVILLDIAMPGMDGYEVCRQLKADERLQQIPVVFLTARKGDRESRLQALEVGAEAFLSKPFDEAELLAQLRAMGKIKEIHSLQRQEQERLSQLVAEYTDQLEQELAEHRAANEALAAANRELEQARAATLNLLDDLQKENAARQESEQKYRTLVESLPDIVMRFDREGRHLFVSDNVRQAVDLSPEQFLGKTHRELGFHGTTCQLWENAIRQVVDAGEAWETEFPFQGKAGLIIFNWRLIPELDEQGQVWSVLSISRDVTAHRQAEQNYQMLFREMLDGFAVHEIILDDQDRPADYRFLAINPAFERMTGLRAQDIIGKTVLEVMPGTEQHWIETYGRVALTGESVSFEEHSGILDRYFEVTAFRPAPGQFACVFADITERRRAEQALERQRAELQAIYDHAPVMMCLLDQERRMLYANRAFAEFTGLPVDQVHTRRACGVFGCIHEHDDPRGCGFGPTCADCPLLAAIEATLRTGASHDELEWHATLMHNGEQRKAVLQGAMVLIGEPGHGELLLCLSDITQRWRSEQALRESERTFATLIGNLPGMVYRCANDRAWTMQFISTGCQEITGYAPEDFINNHTLAFNDIVHPDYQEPLWRQWQECLSRCETFEAEYPIITSAGETRWVWERGEGIWGSAGELLFLEGFITDITAHKQAERVREQLEDQLRQVQKMEAVGRLAGGVAHDFNNMLQVILGHVELALVDMDPANSLREDLEQIRQSAERSASLTRQLLAFARRQTIMPRVLDLNDTVAGMLKMLRRLIGEQIDLVWRPGADLGAVKLDPSQVDQLLANLCVNARDAIGGVGRLAIGTENARLDEAACAGLADAVPGAYVLLTVSDTGCGMDAETLEHLFEPFFTTKEVGQGTGLGLATVYGIVRQNNGIIAVDSVPGMGTTFRIYLPRHGAAAQPVMPGAEAEVPGSRGETILLVEDEPALLSLGQTALSRMGYEVLTAGGPDEALRLVADHPGELHLLVTDVIMPSMNGRELARWVTELKPGIKCLFMSGYNADVMASDGVLAEGANFMQKPFTVKHLAAKVREALEG